MNVQQLRDLLADLDPGDEVRIATQPSWPLAFHVAGVAKATDEPTELVCQECYETVRIRDDEAHHLNPEQDADHEPELSAADLPEDGGERRLEPGVVWIVTGDQPDDPYAPSAAFAQGREW